MHTISVLDPADRERLGGDRRSPPRIDEHCESRRVPLYDTPMAKSPAAAGLISFLCAVCVCGNAGKTFLVQAVA